MSPSSLPNGLYPLPFIPKDLVRDCIKDQVKTTRIGINYFQVGANKATLEALSQEKDAEYKDALAEFQRGKARCTKALSIT